MTEAAGCQQKLLTNSAVKDAGTVNNYQTLSFCEIAIMVNLENTFCSHGEAIRKFCLRQRLSVYVDPYGKKVVISHIRNT